MECPSSRKQLASPGPTMQGEIAVRELQCTTKLQLRSCRVCVRVVIDFPCLPRCRTRGGIESAHNAQALQESSVSPILFQSDNSVSYCLVLTDVAPPSSVHGSAEKGLDSSLFYAPLFQLRTVRRTTTRQDEEGWRGKEEFHPTNHQRGGGGGGGSLHDLTNSWQKRVRHDRPISVNKRYGNYANLYYTQKRQDVELCALRTIFRAKLRVATGVFAFGGTNYCMHRLRFCSRPQIRSLALLCGAVGPAGQIGIALMDGGRRHRRTPAHNLATAGQERFPISPQNLVWK